MQEREARKKEMNQEHRVVSRLSPSPLLQLLPTVYNSDIQYKFKVSHTWKSIFQQPHIRKVKIKR